MQVRANKTWAARTVPSSPMVAAGSAERRRNRTYRIQAPARGVRASHKGYHASTLGGLDRIWGTEIATPTAWYAPIVNTLGTAMLGKHNPMLAARSSKADPWTQVSRPGIRVSNDCAPHAKSPYARLQRARLADATAKKAVLSATLRMGADLLARLDACIISTPSEMPRSRGQGGPIYVRRPVQAAWASSALAVMQARSAAECSD